MRLGHSRARWDLRGENHLSWSPWSATECLSGSIRMQDAGNENASRFTAEERYVLASFHAAQAGANVIAGTAGRRVVGQRPAARFTIVDVTGVVASDVDQVGLGKTLGSKIPDSRFGDGAIGGQARRFASAAIFARSPRFAGGGRNGMRPTATRVGNQD